MKAKNEKFLLFKPCEYVNVACIEAILDEFAEYCLFRMKLLKAFQVICCMCVSTDNFQHNVHIPPLLHLI